MKHLNLLSALAFAAMLHAQTPSSTTHIATAATAAHRATRQRTVRKRVIPPATQKEVEELKQMLEAQQQQLNALQQELAARDQALQASEAQAQQAATAVQTAQQSADQANQKADVIAQNVTATGAQVQTVQSNLSNTMAGVQETQNRLNDAEHPASIHYKGITITPGGFLAAESVYRAHGIGADIGTPFNSVNFAGADGYHQSDFFGSARQSRIALLAEGKYGTLKGSGYYEADFLSAGVTSNNNESNSYTLRQRQLYAQAALESGWTFTGGQMWSLVTETKKGLDNRTEALPLTVDPQYHVGFSWARQYGFRVTKTIGKKVFAGFAVENPQTLVTAHGTAANFNLGQLGNSGGLYNGFNGNYSYNLAPDIIAKVAFEPGFGHYELFGIVSQFRDRIYPNATAATPSALGAYNYEKTGGGIGANARASFFNKHMDFGIHFLGGSGVGRYGTSSLADTTIRPDGTLALLKSYQALGTLEFHSNKWDLYGNAGGEYAGRNSFLNAAGKPVGYGSPLFSNAGCLVETVPAGATGFLPGAPANCTGDTRNILEGSAGLWYKFYNGPMGRLQFGTQYSYIVRNTWAGLGGDPHAIENMVLTSFRYYIP